MTAGDKSFYESLEHMNPSGLKRLAAEQHDTIVELELREKANNRINTEVAIQYAALQEKYSALKADYDKLNVLYNRELEKNDLKVRSTFGRKTEKFTALVSSTQNKASEFEDESQIEEGEDAAAATKGQAPDFSKKQRDDGRKGSGAAKRQGQKTSRKSKLKDSMAKLPREYFYIYDEEELDRKYGKGNWRIAYWHSYETVEKVPAVYYVKEVPTPVVSVGLEHDLHAELYDGKILPHSCVSPSLLADILYGKFCLGLPFHRQSRDFHMNGLQLDKQDMIHWVNKLTPDLLDPVCAHMETLLIHYRYVQCDETYIQVNKDGKAPGHKGYLWVHCSSELLDVPPIVVFCYEPTRNTNHLRRFFGEFLGYITSDAYVSYQVLENENEGITVTGCFMHCRRYFAEAFFLNDVASMTGEELAGLPETKCLLLIRDIYLEEENLKGMSAGDRQTARQAMVKPKVDAFFDYVHELLGSSDAVFADRMVRALNYASNQEDHLRAFLKDGNIPCDNGKSERVIRAYSVGRANWLFADTIQGALVNATVYSIIETAKANNVDVRIYLRYLLEKMSERVSHGKALDPGFMDTLMPWSEEYGQYEAATKQKNLLYYARMYPKPERPRTPRKKETDAKGRGNPTNRISA